MLLDLEALSRQIAANTQLDETQRYEMLAAFKLIYNQAFKDGQRNARKVAELMEEGYL